MATAFKTVDPALSAFESYVENARDKSLLRLLTCGSVDDGKSTLLGRLLYDSRSILDDQLAGLDGDSRKWGTQGDKLDLALLVDGLAAEREQGITIDVAYRYFATDKRKFIVADTPGHEQYTRNMVTGASTADLAIILVDARKGVLTQTRRHSTIVHLLGIRHLVLAVNKMDLVGYSQAAFEAVVADYRAFADEIGIGAVTPIPMSALTGDNIGSHSDEMPWYRGRALLDHLENVPVAGETPLQGEFHLPVQWVNRPDSGFRGYAGRVAGGMITPGDAVRVLPSGRRSTIARIVTSDGDLERAIDGQSVNLTLADDVDCSRGDVIVAAGATVGIANRLAANLVWMAEDDFVAGRSYWLKLGPATVSATVSRVDHLLDVDSGRNASARPLVLNDIGHVELSLDRSVAATRYAESHELGAFILIDKRSRATVAAGMIDGFPDTGVTIDRDRIYWLADPGDAERVRQRLQQSGHPTTILDEAALRDLPGANRLHNARTVALLMSRAGMNVVMAIDAPVEERWPGRAYDKDEGADEWVI